MEFTVITKIGNFEFKEHFNSTAEAYQAMCMFVSCNWRMLGDFHYKLKTENGETIFDGINASANLDEYIELCC